MSDNVAAAGSSLAELFDQVYGSFGPSPTRLRIWREVYGSEYPEEAEPFSFVTVSELERMAQELAVGPGNTIADLACGAGGPGLWVTRLTGANLVGIDFSNVALEMARKRAEQWGLSGQARFQPGEFARTGLDEASVDGAMSVDAIQIPPDRAASAAEVFRILKPSAAFVFTTWRLDRDVGSREHPDAAFRPRFDPAEVMEAAGFRVEACDEPELWREREVELQRLMLEAEDDLRNELAAEFVDGLIAEAKWSDQFLAAATRVLVVARKP